MRTRLIALFLILMVGSFMSLAQTATPAPKSDDKHMCACCKGEKGEGMKAGEGCCKDCPKDKDGKMACMKDGKCTADCPMMKDGKMACMQDGKMACMKDGKCTGCPMKDGKMACMKDGKCTADCPMMKDGKMACMQDGKCADCPKDKDGKMACMKDGKCTADCPMMKKENKSTASGEMKGCCSGDKCKAEKMHEHAVN